MDEARPSLACRAPGPWHFSHATPASVQVVSNVPVSSRQPIDSPVAWHERHSLLNVRA